MTMALRGAIDWNLTRDKEGHREYKIQWLCESNDWNDGPERAYWTPGLPAIGSTWAFGNDLDLWAFCWPNATVKPVLTKERQNLWIVENMFSTKPLSRCQDTDIENPLNEPMEISGSFVKYTKEIAKNKDDEKIASSSHERIRGPIMEFDHNRPTVTIGMNLLTLPLSTFAPMVDTVNNHVLWGLGVRRVKLSNVQWERKLYGTCTFYYTVTYEFDIDYTTFDRVTWDEGTKILSAGGNVNNPDDFEQYKDVNGENTRVFLDGAGNALTNGAAPVEIDIKFYNESNFFTLGIPASL